MAGGRRAPATTLTPLQVRFMRVLQRRLADDPDRGVSFEELRRDLGISSRSGVARLVDGCVARGRITHMPRKPRSLRILSPVDEAEVRSAGLSLVDDGLAVAPTADARSLTDEELLIEAARRGLLVSAHDVRGLACGGASS